MSEFDIAHLRCLAYHNGLMDYKNALSYGLEAYNMPESRQDTKIFLSLLEIIADDYYQNGNYEESVRTCTEGLKLASDSLLRTKKANFYVALAQNLREFGRKDEAYLKLGEAADILEKEAARSRQVVNADDYVYSLGVYIQSLYIDGRYRDAIAMLPRYEQAMDCLESKDDIPDGLVDMRRASAYGMFADMLAHEGDNRKADELYRKLLETDYSKTPDGVQLAVPYLLARKRYAEALREYWKANADTLNYNYITFHLKREQEAFTGLNKTAEALRVANTIQQMNDTLRERDRSAKTLELAEIYKTQEQALQIERQSVSILLRNIIIIASLAVFIVGGLFIARILRLNRTISNKNKAMVGTIDDLISYKDRVLELQEENLQLKAALNDNPESEVSGQPSPEPLSDIVPAAVEKESEADIPTNEAAKLTDGDRAFFERMNFEILSQRLYLDPCFSRSTVLTRFRIPAYKFSSLFKEYAGCTFSQYIHNCRLDYAVKLMRENPSWSLDAIANAAQMSSSSFYSQFKKKYGMNPSDFKSTEPDKE